MRRYISLLLLGVLLTAVASACSNEPKGKKNEPVTLKAAVASEGQFAKFKGYLEEKFPHVTFDVIGVLDRAQGEMIDLTLKQPEDWTKFQELNRSIIEDDQPDFYFGYIPAPYSDQAELVDLNPLLQFNQITLNPVQRSLFGLDQSFDKKLEVVSPTYIRDLLFINRKMFQSHHITEPSSHLSWDQFRQLAEPFASPPVKSGYMLPSVDLISNLYRISNVIGLSAVDENGQVMIHQEPWRELARQLVGDLKNGTAKLASAPTSERPWSRTAMYMGSTADLHKFALGNENPEDWTVMAFPYSPEAYDSELHMSEIFSIDSSSRYINEVWEMLEYLLGEEAAMDITSRNLSTYAVTYTEHILSSGLQLDVLNQIGDRPANAKPSSPSRLSRSGNTALFQALNRQLNLVVNEDIGLDEAWDQLEVIVNEMNANPANFENNSE
ncbi:extracellular solute-binding protein [Paenibacillus sp. NPDC057967]|uniref:extracellular solute-binding protein n=1 Tax=Paenibacillus sp. NPDC057967 TaxID=3346293 RepID=UPI0036DD549E